MPPGGGFERERGVKAGNMKIIPKPLLDADAPQSGSHKGAEVIAKVVLDRVTILLSPLRRERSRRNALVWTRTAQSVFMVCIFWGL